MDNNRMKENTNSAPAQELQRTAAEQNYMEIDLVELWYLFCSKLLYIVLAVLIGGIVAGFGTYFFISQKYTATSKIYIVSASSGSVINLSDLQIGTNLTSDFGELIKSRPMMESTIQNLELEMSVKELSDILKVVNPSGTRILEITVTHTDPVIAAKIANEVARLSINWLAVVMESNEPHIVEDAIVPTVRSSPSYMKNTVLGAFLVGALYFGICVLKYLLKDTISSEEEAERRLGLIPLASIPEDKYGATKDKSVSSEKGTKSRGR